MKNVKELLKKEQQAKDILANIGREKEELAINKLTELKEILAALDCSYLLETNTIEKIVEKEIEKIVEKVVEVEVVKEVVVEKIVEVEVPGPVQVVQDMTEIEKHLDTIAKQKKEIEMLRKELAEKEAQLEEKKINEKVSNVLSNRTKKERKSAIDMINEAPDVDDIGIEIEIPESINPSEEEDYMAFLTSQEESIMSEINAYEQIIEEPKEEIVEVKEENKDTDKPQFVTVSNAKVGKNPNAKLYQTEKCYLIASPTTDEITWLSNEELSDAYKIAVENMLVAEHKFLTNRTKLSPVKINRNNGYMARSSAIKGITEFSMEDVLVGYVKIDNKFYLYSYCPKYARPNVDSLEAIIAKQNKTMPNMSIVTKVTAVVIDMYKEYKALIDATKKETEKVAEENAKSFNEKQEARKAQREGDEALIAAAGLLDKVKKNKKKVVPTVSFSSSSILDDIEAQLF